MHEWLSRWFQRCTASTPTATWSLVLFDLDAIGHDGLPYHNNYTWYFQMKDATVFKVIAFFDTQKFDEFWTRVRPKP